MAYIVTQEVEAEERIDRRDPEATLRQFVRATAEADYNNTDAAKAAASALAADIYKGLTLTSVRFNQVGRGVWLSELLYKLMDGQPQPQGVPDVGAPGPPPEPPPNPAPEPTSQLNENFTFSTKGGTQKLKQSFATRHKIPSAGILFPPDHGRAIGVSKDGVEGCEIITGKIEWTYTTIIPAVSFAYIRTLERLTGTMNVAEFFHHAAGECLFLGADGQLKGPEGCSVTFSFLSGKNRADVDAGHGIIFPTVEAHDYVWFQYAPATSEGKPSQKPIAGYVEQVYEYTDFYELGIGGTLPPGP
jgi:hypothetical protein